MTVKPEIESLVDHFFRHEAGKIVSVLTKIFGTSNLDLAEDVVQDALVEALDHWQYNGVPDNPSAWLFRVAKNKALNIVNREGSRRKYESAVTHLMKSEMTAEPALSHLFSEQEIQDDQLRMIFTCCHPDISPDSQIALALKTLCGFSIPEIARAFLTSEENINKRLVRARQTIRDSKLPFEVPQGKDLDRRLNVVLETIYLLFNEGYSASRGEEVIRYEVCEEAIRLCQIIIAGSAIQRKETVHALAALMFLNAARFKARQNSEGNLLTMAEQDRSLWDRQMIGIGLTHLSQATQNESISIFHILAAISAQHCISPDYESTDWKNILSLYDSLAILDNSPVVLLNRAIALAKVEGPETALEELAKIKDNPSLKSYYLFYSTQAEFFIHAKQYREAVVALKKAIQLAPLEAEKALLNRKLQLCNEKTD